MDGSPLLFILMIFVITPLLGGWLAVIFYVSSHPAHKTQSAASETASRNSTLVPPPRSAPAEPAHRKGAVPGRGAPLHVGAERPAA
jgi:hypothetical protein